MYQISAFSDAYCQDWVETVVPSGNVMDNGYGIWHSHDSNCVYMGDGVQWKSVMPMTTNYIGYGVNNTDGTDTWGNDNDW